jgi:hypothetical protein
MMKKFFCIVTIIIVASIFSTTGTWAASADQKTLAAQIAALQTAVATLQGQVTTLQGQLADYKAFFEYITVQSGEINGLAGPHVIFTGANVHIRSGSSTTYDGGSLTGLGNLIVGYNQLRPGDGAGQRGGSHNIVVGDHHRFTSYGGLVAGYENEVSRSHASVTGGFHNTASGYRSSICGGYFNTASGDESSVSGGHVNTASGPSSSVSGGYSNTASGGESSISGGAYHSAGSTWNWVAGGLFQAQ